MGEEEQERTHVLVGGQEVMRRKTGKVNCLCWRRVCEEEKDWRREAGKQGQEMTPVLVRGQVV